MVISRLATGEPGVSSRRAARDTPLHARFMASTALPLLPAALSRLLARRLFYRFFR